LYYIILRQKTEFCRDGTKTPVSVTDNRTFMNCWDTFRTKPTQNIPIFRHAETRFGR